MQTILKPNFSFYNIIDQKAGCLNFLILFVFWETWEHSDPGNLLWGIYGCWLKQVMKLKNHTIYCLCEGWMGVGGFVNLERFVEGVVGGWVIKTKQVQTRGNGSSKFWSFCDNVITEFRWHKWSLVRKHTWANIK